MEDEFTIRQRQHIWDLRIREKLRHDELDDLLDQQKQKSEANKRFASSAFDFGEYDTNFDTADVAQQEYHGFAFKAQKHHGKVDGTYYKLDGKTLHVHNTLQEPGKLEARPCERCGESKDGSGTDSFLLCENAKCKSGGGHLRCLRLKSIPEGQWFCSKCCKTVRCEICRKTDGSKAITSCNWCELVFHTDCIAQEVIVHMPTLLDSDWRCPNCACQKCGEQERGENKLLACCSCNLFWHTLCVDLPDDAEVFMCDGCKQEETDLEEYTRANGLIKNVDSNNGILRMVSSFSDAVVDDYAESYIHLVDTLHKLQCNNPLLYFVVKQNILKQVSFDGKEDWEDLVRLVKTFAPDADIGSKKPPQKLGRLLDRIMPVNVLERELTVEYKEFDLQVQGTFYYRDLVEVVSQLVHSPSNCRNVPCYKVETDCDANSRWGPRLNRLDEEFRKLTMASDEDSVFPLQFYSDGTGTNFMSLHPIIVSIFTFDRSCRVLNMKTAQSVWAMVPTSSNLEFYLRGSRISQGQAKSLVQGLTSASILRQMLRQSVTVVMEELSKLESGVATAIDGKKMYGYLYSWICDMEERRDILHLSAQNHWVCTHCFGRPAAKSIPCPNKQLDSLVMKGALRTFETEDLLRSFKVDDHTYAARGEKEWSFERRFGFTQDSIPVFSPKKNFLLDGASSYFLFDRLHVLDGIILKLWDIFKAVYQQKALSQITERLGNVSYGVATDMRFHKMEEALHDFQYFALALYVAGPEIPVKSSRWQNTQSRRSHARMTAAFLCAVICLKDDAPGLVQSRLDASVQIFHRELTHLRNQLREEDAEISDITAKMHEFLDHVAVQVRENGPSSHFSSDIGEWSHDLSKNYVHSGSKRRADQAKTVLKRNVYASAMDDENEKNTGTSLLYHTKLNAVASFRIMNNDMGQKQMLEGGHNAKVEQILRNNLRALFRAFQSLRKTLLTGIEAILEKSIALLPHLEELVAFGSSVECSLKCANRNVRIKRELIASVIRSADIRRHRALAFRASAGTPEHTGKACCRHHDPACELHCSYDRLQDGTAFGLPLLFFADPNNNDSPSALIVKLHVVREEELPDDLIFNEVFAQCNVNPNELFDVIMLSRLRTTCLVVHENDRFVVLRAGERTFGHLQ